jgi:hypothetical protein
MAEDPVSQDQHRADMAELRLDLANTLASLDKRTELIAQDLVAFRRETTERFEHLEQQSTERFEQVERQIAEGRETMLLRFEQMDQRFEQAERQRAEDRQVMMQQRTEDRQTMMQQRAEDRQVMMQQFQQIDQQFARHETRLLSLENWMRTTYVTLAVVVVGVAAQLFYTLLRFGLKPPTS